VQVWQDLPSNATKSLEVDQTWLDPCNFALVNPGPDGRDETGSYFLSGVFNVAQKDAVVAEQPATSQSCSARKSGHKFGEGIGIGLVVGLLFGGFIACGITIYYTKYGNSQRKENGPETPEKDYKHTPQELHESQLPYELYNPSDVRELPMREAP